MRPAGTMAVNGPDRSVSGFCICCNAETETIHIACLHVV